MVLLIRHNVFVFVYSFRRTTLLLQALNDGLVRTKLLMNCPFLNQIVASPTVQQLKLDPVFLPTYQLSASVLSATLESCIIVKQVVCVHPEDSVPEDNKLKLSTIFAIDLQSNQVPLG
jgi:hypothetical protein